MATAESPISDMLVTVKSREIQRGLLAEMRGDRKTAARHLLAAAHLELVLAKDYEIARQARLAFRSLLSAASCMWQAGECDQALRLLQQLKRQIKGRRAEIDEVIEDLRKNGTRPKSR